MDDILDKDSLALLRGEYDSGTKDKFSRAPLANTLCNGGTTFSEHDKQPMAELASDQMIKNAVDAQKITSKDSTGTQPVTQAEEKPCRWCKTCNWRIDIA